MLYLDRPVWPGRGRLWCHLVSDVSYAELHAFAELLGIPRRGFDRDHYDLPAQRYQVAVWLGARPVESRMILQLLHTAGLRRPRQGARAAHWPDPPGSPIVAPRAASTPGRG